MEHALLKLMHETEGSWWYRGRIIVMQTALQCARIKKRGRALDLGAGYGGMFSFFRQYADRVDAFEPDQIAMQELSRRGYARVFSDTESALAQQHDIIGLFDVLEHIEDDKGMLVRLHDSLSENGVLVLNVPAYQWLWSDHDVRNMHFRRYRARGLRRRLVNAGFNVRYLGYWNTVLFPVAAIVRVFGFAGEGGLSPGGFINTILLMVIRIEAFIMRIVPLPFGLSVVAVAVKKQ